MNLSSIFQYGVLAIVLGCVIFLVNLFGIMPLPYIISAAILKIPNRGYWKAFGSAILGGLAGAATTTVVVLITAAITGSFANLRDAVGFGGMLALMSGGLIFGWIIGAVGSIIVQMAITGGLYNAGFGKGALIWLLAMVFGFLLSAAVALIIMAVSFSTFSSWISSLQNLFNGGYQYFIPSLLPVM